MTKSTIRKTDKVKVFVIDSLEKIITGYNQVKEFTKSVLSFLKAVLEIVLEIIALPVKLFKLWNRGYSVKPIMFLNGLATKKRKRRIGADAFAYDFETEIHKYKFFIYFDLFQGGFVINEPISYMSSFRNYNDYKTPLPMKVVKTLWPTLYDLRVAYKVAIESSKLVIEEDSSIKSLENLGKELNEVEVGSTVHIIAHGNPKNALEYSFKKDEEGFQEVVGYTHWFKKEATSQELAKKMHEEGFRVYNIEQ